MNKFTFGFNVFNYTPEEFMEYAGDNDLRHIEINLSKKHSDLDSFSTLRVENLKTLTAKHNVKLSLHLPYNTNIADNIILFSKGHMEYVCNAITLAHELHAEFITCHMGFFFWFPMEQWKREKALARFTRNLKKILSDCAEKDVCIAIENVTPLPQGSEHLLLGDNLNDFEFVFNEVKSDQLKFCFDTGHANVAEGIDSYLDAFGDRIRVIHYHDNKGNDDSHLPVGEGNIDWPGFVKKIKAVDFTGPFISECRNVKPKEASDRLKKYLTD